MAAESVLTKLADEVAAAINAGSYAESGLRACRTFKPVKRREELEGRMLVEVLPRSQTRERVARGVWQASPTIVVGITKQIDENDVERQTDHCLAVADAIAETLQAATFTNGYLRTITEEPTYHPTRLDQDGVFTRALVLTFGGRAAYGS